MKKQSLASKMFLAMSLGLISGVGFLFLRETLLSNGNEATWTSIYNFLFQDITQAGATNAIGLFYIIGQLFINSLQLIIVPMVFTSLVMAMCHIKDTSKLKRISYKTLGGYLFTSIVALLFASVVGMIVYNMGLFNVSIEGLEAGSGTVGSNPLNILLQIIPTNITDIFTQNGRILSVVFVAVVVGISINLSKNEDSILKKVCEEVHHIITTFLTMVVSKFGPIAIFVLLTRTFAIYGIQHLTPALVYVVTTVCVLFAYLVIGYACYVAGFAKVNPFIFLKKVSKVAVFGFSTSSSASTLPLNIKTTVEELGVSEDVASFALPLGMTVNMDGTAIMQVIATIFIAGCAGYDLTFGSVLLISVIALIASIGTPAAPGAGAVILFTVLSGMNFTSDQALLAYSLILAINRPIEMLVTSLNVVGDSAVALCVAKSENELNVEVFNREVQQDQVVEA